MWKKEASQKKNTTEISFKTSNLGQEKATGTQLMRPRSETVAMDRTLYPSLLPASVPKPVCRQIPGKSPGVV